MSPPTPRITLSYIGVHQIFQLALAASEMGELNTLHCSMIDRPGKWGRWLSHWANPPSLRPLGYDSLPNERIVEHPFPILIHRFIQKVLPARKSEHFRSADWFDRLVASRINSENTKLFVGSEISSLHSLKAAKKHGLHSILDCPGIPNAFLDSEAAAAAQDLGLAAPLPSNSTELIRRKNEELALASVVLACSDFQASKIAEQGIAPSRVRTVPLWVDADFWSRKRPRDHTESTRALRIIYAGTLSLKKGVPYLIQALRRLPVPFECLLVGRISPEMAPFLSDLPSGCRIESYVPKDRLRQLYSEHHVLVMPSLGDSFGFVGMEAMAAGLPVIASSNAGVPLPSPDWRIPARDAEALTQRLMHYATHRDVLADDSAQAAAFARQFTPQRYRDQIKDIYRELLSFPT